MRDEEVRRGVAVLEADGFDMRWATSLDEAIETIIEQRQAALAKVASVEERHRGTADALANLDVEFEAVTDERDAARKLAVEARDTLAAIAGAFNGYANGDRRPRRAEDTLALIGAALGPPWEAKTDKIARCKGCGAYLELDQTHHGSHVVDCKECGPVEWVDREKPEGMP